MTCVTRRVFVRLCALACLAFSMNTSASVFAEAFELKSGDRVVFLGSTLIEREQRDGYLETALTLTFSEPNITYRNLGWSGDTVWGHSRAGFGSPEDGFKEIQKHVAELKPTVMFLGYGTNESFAGEKGLAEFEVGLKRLWDMLDKASPGMRYVVLGVPQMENLGPPLPDPKEQNERIKLYNGLLAKTAQDRGARFIDTYTILERDQSKPIEVPLTDNGMHFTPRGYRAFALAVMKGLIGKSDPPNPIDSKPSTINVGVERLRQLILEKNMLYFHRWRPQNVTYLFGFRKHEQGNNASDIPKFDPLIAELEKKIAETAKPLQHEFHLKAK